MKFSKHGGAAALLTLGAALVAAGCGSGSGGGASDAVKDSKALDYIPKSAIGYMTLDTDFKGDNWKQFDKLAKGFKADFTSVADQIDKESNKGSDKVDFSKDVDPWLGDHAGAALLSASSSKDVKFVVWAEIDDKSKFEGFAKKEDLKKGKKVGDFDVWTGKDKTFVGVSDDLAFIAPDKATLESTLKYDGDSITDAKGVDKVAGEVGDDTLAAVVVSGDGVRDALKNVKDQNLETLTKSKNVKDFQGLAMGVSAEDKGFHVHASGESNAKVDAKQGGTDLLQTLPEDTILAIGGQDLGGTLKTGIEGIGESNAQVQQGIGAITGALGVDLDDIATAFSGEFALGVNADDAGLQSLVGGVAGAAMGGGASSLTASNLLSSGSVTLAFENGTTTTDTLDKLVGSVGGLTGGGAPTVGKAGDFETKTLDVRGLPVTAASSKDVAALSIGKDVFTTWGSKKLNGNKAFSEAWDASGAPDDVSLSFFLDWPRVAKLMNVKEDDKVKAGGWVGWASAKDTSSTFDVFMHVKDA